MAINLPKSESGSNREKKQSVFLQSWKTLTGPKSPKTIKKLFKTAKKFNACLEGLAFNPSITSEMPIWYHKKADPRIQSMIKNEASKCLIKNHKAIKVNEIEKLAESLQNINHTVDPNCLCENCIENGDAKQCGNPHHCYEQAEKLIQLLPSKWNPRIKPPSDQNIIVDNTNDPNKLKRQYFSRDYIIDGSLADAFRIFVEGDTKNEFPQKRIDDEEMGIVKVQIMIKLGALYTPPRIPIGFL